MKTGFRMNWPRVAKKKGLPEGRSVIVDVWSANRRLAGSGWEFFRFAISFKKLSFRPGLGVARKHALVVTERSVNNR